jgi:DNA-binding transcriptional MocR family regulator
MPDFHNPTGLVMAERVRASYARLLGRYDATAVVDEAHHELRLDPQRPRRPFAAYADDAITLGSASKAVWGGLRLGWIRSPLGLIDTLTQARVGLDLGAPVLEQLVLARLLTEGIDGLLDVHRARLVRQRDAMIDALTEHLPDWEFRHPTGGMVLWCQLPRAGAVALAAAAERHGVLLAPGPAFAPEGGLDRWIRLPFTLAEDQLVEAVRRIGVAWAEVEAGTTTPPGRRRPSGVMVA